MRGTNVSGANRTKRFFVFFAGVLLTTGFASAAQAAGGGGHGFSASDWLNLLWRVITFGLVAAVIWYFAGKKIAAFFRGRQSGIEKELHDFEVRKEEARKTLEDVEKRIANLESERQAILDEYKARAEAMASGIIAKAEERAAQITAQAEQAAAGEVEQAVAAMRAELAEAVAETTRALLADSLTPKQHEELIDSFLNKVVLQ